MQHLQTTLYNSQGTAYQVGEEILTYKSVTLSIRHPETRFLRLQKVSLDISKYAGRRITL
jgi:hypothetical protein